MFGSPTIKEVVQNGLSKNLSHTNIHFKVGYVGSDGIRRVYNWDSIIDKYRDILLGHTHEVVLTDREMEDYRFQPRAFCQDFYANADLWSVLLRINNMLTSTDFNRKRFLALGPRFTDTLNEILSIEDDYLMKSVIEAKTAE